MARKRSTTRRKGKRIGSGLRKAKRGSATRSSNELKYIPLGQIKRVMKTIAGNNYRIAKTGAFGLSYLIEMVTQDLIKFAITALEHDRKRSKTILPRHLLNGISQNKDIRNGIYKVISNLEIKQQIAELNSQLNARSTRSRSRSPQGSPRRRSGSRRRSTSSKRSRKSRSKKRSSSVSPSNSPS